MKPYYEDIVESERLFYKDNHNWIFKGDCRSMYELPNECIQMVCTSPPFWGLRKYSGEQELIWGGDENCEHRWGAYVTDPVHPQSRRCSTCGRFGLTVRTEGENVVTVCKNCGGKVTESMSDTFGLKSQQGKKRWQHGEFIIEDVKQGNFCSLCGAWKGAYGLEPDPESYVAHTIQILREIRRVLRKDGVVFWDIGDSYASSRPMGTSDNFDYEGGFGYSATQASKGKGQNKIVSGMKPKDLCLIPFRVAIAAQEDGWWVRSVIIWSKPNPMPESVTDRPTESHEYILMLTKSSKYYWDADAVREEHATGWRHDKWEDRTYNGKKAKAGIKDAAIYQMNPAGRNIRTVWEFPTQPYPEAHFAVFPEKLPEICIKAATPEVGCCSKCGAPWERLLSRGFTSHDAESKTAYTNEAGHNAHQLAKLRQAARAKGGEYRNTKESLGWQPTCKCNADKVPSLCLDPFAGAGTTLWVAKRLGRRGVGYELSEEYCALSVERNRQQGLL